MHFTVSSPIALHLCTLATLCESVEKPSSALMAHCVVVSRLCLLLSAARFIRAIQNQCSESMRSGASHYFGLFSCIVPTCGKDTGELPDATIGDCDAAALP